MQITAKNLTFTYNKKSKFSVKALDGVSVEIEEGDFFGIIGHTGSGKSTFVQHLNSLIPVQEGNLQIGEFDLSKVKKKERKNLINLRKKVGMVFQYPEHQLFAETVFDDVAFGYRNFYKESSEEEVKSAVIDAVEKVGLDLSVLSRSPFDLSGGQKRRVAIAGVIVSKPEILVLDEPVAGLDPKGKKELMNLLHKLHGEFAKTVVIISHDMDEVCDNCNKVAVFSHGKIVKFGTPKEVFFDTKEIKEIGLEEPITKYLQDELKKVGVNLDLDYSTENFIKEIIKKKC